MSNLINVEKISKTFGLKQLLADVSLGIESQDRIGVVGLNGGGKSTLLRILAGEEPADSGRVSRVSGLRMAVVTQDGNLPSESSIQEVIFGTDAEHTWASDSRVREILTGTGISDIGLERNVTELSGGQRRRVALAAALVQELDLLILDEPTNHLDIDGAAWLANHLVSRPNALIVVTHDRWFLDTVATRTWEVHDARVDAYEGGYNDWVFARAERVRLSDAAEERRRNLARKELAWLRRGPPARTSKPKYRIEAAEKLIADVPAPRDSVALTAFAKRRLGRVVIELEDARIATPDDRILADNLTWRLTPGERIGLVGINGSGKTTLLRALAGAVAVTPGKRIEGKTVEIGWLRQELDDLPADITVHDAVADIAGTITIGDRELSAAQLAERLGFTPARQRTAVGELSGGERRRLQLTRVLMAQPNVLLLDEPTNDLDIDTLQQLEDLLDGWVGTLVVISHDRYLIERICDSTWALFGDGKLTNLPRGIEQYLAELKDIQSSGNNSKALGVQKNSSDSGAARDGQKLMRKLERQIVKFDQHVAQLHEQLAESVADTAKLAQLGAELKSVEMQKEEAELQWLELAELWQ